MNIINGEENDEQFIIFCSIIKGRNIFLWFSCDKNDEQNKFECILFFFLEQTILKEQIYLRGIVLGLSAANAICNEAKQTLVKF